MITENLDTFLNDFGVPFSFGLVSGLCIFDQPDQVLGAGVTISTDYSILAKASDFSGVKRGDTVTVNSVGYIVREPHLLDDGSFIRILLELP